MIGFYIMSIIYIYIYIIIYTYIYIYMYILIFISRDDPVCSQHQIPLNDVSAAAGMSA